MAAVRKGRTRSKGDGRDGRGPCLVPGLELRVGQLVAGKYRVEALIGTGASGVVLAAHHIHMRRPVSLKILASYTDAQDDVLARRVKKARDAARLRGEHVARVVDIGVTEHGMPYVASEALEGITLADEIATRGKLPVQEAAARALEICEGLAEAHPLGLVHGDLKPGNLFLAERDGERVLKILDFGSTSPIEAIGDQSASAFFGSPAFLAPEQIRDATKLDARADVWAVGVLLHHMISGELPFSADTVSGVLVAVVYDSAPLLIDAPYELAKIVHQCLSKDAARRPADVGELAAMLAPWALGDGARASARVRALLDAPSSPPASDASASGSVPPISIEAEPTKPSRRVEVRRRRTRAHAIGAALLAVIASLGIVAWTTGTPTNAPAPAAPAIAEPTAPPITAPSASAPVDAPSAVPTMPAPPRPTSVPIPAEAPVPQAIPQRMTPRSPIRPFPSVKRPPAPSASPRPPPMPPPRSHEQTYYRKLFDRR
ncbi:MAG: protein kinase [Labilithrix sp.]|nr:protein kinase [Labilithrix sp.]